MKIRGNHHIAVVTAIIAVGVQHRWQASGAWHGCRPQRSRAVLGRVPAHLTHRGLRGARLVISNAHEDLNAIVDKTINGKWQRCLVGLLKNAGGL